MNTWRIQGWAASQVRVETLLWLDRLSVMTAMAPVGLASSARHPVSEA